MISAWWNKNLSVESKKKLIPLYAIFHFSFKNKLIAFSKMRKMHANTLPV